MDPPLRTRRPRISLNRIPPLSIARAQQQQQGQEQQQQQEQQDKEKLPALVPPVQAAPVAVIGHACRSSMDSAIIESRPALVRRNQSRYLAPLCRSDDQPMVLSECTISLKQQQQQQRRHHKRKNDSLSVGGTNDYQRPQDEFEDMCEANAARVYPNEGKLLERSGLEGLSQMWTTSAGHTTRDDTRRAHEAVAYAYLETMAALDASRDFKDVTYRRANRECLLLIQRAHRFDKRDSFDDKAAAAAEAAAAAAI